MRILLFLSIFLLPLCASAQILRAYGVIEIGSFPTSSATGPKFAYNPADSSFYRWSHGSVWVKVIEPSITSDTIFITDQIGTSYVVSGDTINLTPYLLKSDTTAMLVKYIERGDTASMLANYPTKSEVAASPTTITANYIATSNGSNLIARNLFDNNTYAGVISRPWKFGEYTTAGLPTGVTGYTVYNTTTNGLAWYQGSRWAYGLESTFNRGTAGRIPFFDANGQVEESQNLYFDNANRRLAIGTTSPTKLFTLFGPTGSQGLGIDKGSDPNFWKIEKISGGNGFIQFSNNDINVSDRLSLPTTGVATFRSGNQNPQASHFVNTNYRMYFSGGIGNANVGGGSDGGDLYFIGGDSGNTDSGITGGNIYIQGGQAYNKGTSFSGNVILNWSNFGLVGIRTQDPTRTLDLNGELRIRDVVTDAPTTLIGVDGDGDVGSFALSGLSISGGTITSQNIYNTNGTFGANRQATLTDSLKILVSGNDIFKIKSNGSLYSVARGLTNSFVHSMEPNENYDNITGNVYLSGSTSALDTTTGTRRNKYDASYFSGRNTVTGGASSFFLAIAGYGNNHKTSSNLNSVFGLYNETSGSNGVIFGNFNTGGGAIFGYSNTNTGGGAIFGNGLNNASQNAYLYGSSSGQTQHFFGADDSDADSARLVLGANNSHVNTNLLLIDPTSGKRFIDARATATEGSARYFGIKSDGVIETAYGTGTKEAADLSKTQSAYIAGFATDGTVLDYNLDSIPSIYNKLPNESVTIDANANSLVINNVTDFELSSETGNGSLLFNYETFQVESNTSINLSTNGDARLEITDAAELRVPNLEGYNTFRINDSGFYSTFTNTLADPDSAMSMITSHDRGLLKLHKYGKDNHVATITGEYSERIAGLTPNGLVQDFRLTRDTFIEDVTLFAVGTLLHDCQELTIVSSMTSTASSHMEIRFPDAADYLRGRKIIVYSKKKDAGSYIPEIRVVGGASRLYFTTNSAVLGTDPIDQSVLQIDDSTWSDHGTTFEFTCLKIDNTPSYRWVLKQR